LLNKVFIIVFFKASTFSFSAAFFFSPVPTTATSATTSSSFSVGSFFHSLGIDFICFLGCFNKIKIIKMFYTTATSTTTRSGTGSRGGRGGTGSRGRRGGTGSRGKNAVEKEKVEALKKTIINTLFNNFNNFLVILSQNTHV
jgi:hypothetical protein